MADISTRMSVSGLSEYKSAMKQAADSVKTLDEQLKLNEAQYKNNGDAEQYMANKAAILKNQISAQQTVVKNTGTVLMFSQLVGVCIWVFDFVATSAVQMILNVFGA